MEQKWKNKIAAGFTTSGAPSGDKLSTLQYLQTFAMQHGKISVVTGETGVPGSQNPLGSWMGAMAQFTHDPSDPINDQYAPTGELFGNRIAEITTEWK